MAEIHGTPGNDVRHRTADPDNIFGWDGIAGNQAFTFIGAGPYTGVAGQLRLLKSGSTTSILGDVNGDGASDLQNVITNPIVLSNLTSADFVL